MIKSYRLSDLPSLKFTRVCCPYGRHDMVDGVCRCGHRTPRRIERDRRVAKSFYDESLSRP